MSHCRAIGPSDNGERRYAGLTPAELRRCAEAIGPDTAALVDLILRTKPHPEQGFRACLGIVRLARPHGREALEAACLRAREIGGLSYSSVMSILRNNLHRHRPEAPAEGPAITHPNIRRTGGARPAQRQLLQLNEERRMLDHPTHQRLRALKLDDMADAFAEIQGQDAAAELSHAEWLGLLVDREAASRSTRRFQSRMRRQAAPWWSVHRGRRLPRPAPARSRAVPPARPGRLDREAAEPADHRPLRPGQDLARLRARPEGLPRRQDRPLPPPAAVVRRTRTRPWRRSLPPPLPSDRPSRSAYPRRLGPDRLTAPQRRDLMEIVEDRHGAGSIVITSQLPVDAWHAVIDEPTCADAILDRLVHYAHRLTLDGPSLRKSQP